MLVTDRGCLVITASSEDALSLTPELCSNPLYTTVRLVKRYSLSFIKPI